MLAGDTNYSKITTKVIIKQLNDLRKYSIDIISENKPKVDGIEDYQDLTLSFSAILLHAERYIELIDSGLKSLKEEKPTMFLINGLIEIGNFSIEENRKIGKNWNSANESEELYFTESRDLYKTLRDYVVALSELQGVALAIQDRYFKDGKPLYKESIKDKWYKKPVFIIIGIIASLITIVSVFK